MGLAGTEVGNGLHKKEEGISGSEDLAGILLPLPRPQRSIGKAMMAVKQHFPKIPVSCKASMMGAL